MDRTPVDESRTFGCLAGLAIGDAMGMPTSFLTPAQIQTRYGRITTFESPEPGHIYHDGLSAGEVTDDTEQALALVRSFLRHKRVDPYDIAAELVDWSRRVEGKYVSPLGPSTARALQAIMSGASVQEAGRTGDTNGAAMRIAPLGVIHGLRRSPLPEVVRDVALACMPTHGTNVAIASAAAVAWAIAVCYQGVTDPRDVLAAASKAAAEGLQHGVAVVAPSVSIRIDWSLRALAADEPPEAAVNRLYDMIGAGVAAAETVPVALGVFLAAKGDPATTIRLATNMGGDCDTIAAIAGAIAGAYAGIEAVPEEWVATVQDVNALNLRESAADLAAIAREWQPAASLHI